ncbi:MAG TPA: hypothetical protein VFE46_03025 [Pirellulales bacterium]|nr:hypothetical protein [Pirellulales bacterium]
MIHPLFKSSAGLLPHITLHGNGAISFLLTIVFAGRLSTTTLVFAVILMAAIVCFGGGASTLSGTGVLSISPLAFAIV